MAVLQVQVEDLNLLQRLGWRSSNELPPRETAQRLQAGLQAQQRGTRKNSPPTQPPLSLLLPLC